MQLQIMCASTLFGILAMHNDVMAFMECVIPPALLIIEALLMMEIMALYLLQVHSMHWEMKAIIECSTSPPLTRMLQN